MNSFQLVLSCKLNSEKGVANAVARLGKGPKLCVVYIFIKQINKMYGDNIFFFFFLFCTFLVLSANIENQQV